MIILKSISKNVRSQLRHLRNGPWRIGIVRLSECFGSSAAGSVRFLQALNNMSSLAPNFEDAYEMVHAEYIEQRRTIPGQTKFNSDFRRVQYEPKHVKDAIEELLKSRQRSRSPVSANVYDTPQRDASKSTTRTTSTNGLLIKSQKDSGHDLRRSIDRTNAYPPNPVRRDPSSVADIWHRRAPVLCHHLHSSA